MSGVLGQNLSRSAAWHGSAKALLLPLPVSIPQPSYCPCRMLQPQDKARLGGTSGCWGRRMSMPVARHYVCMVNVSPWRNTTFPSNLGSSSVLRSSSPCLPWDVALWSRSDFGATIVAVPWSRTTVATEASPIVAVPCTPCSPWGRGWRGRHPHTSATSLKESTQSQDGDAQSRGAVNTTLQMLGKGKRGLPLTSEYLLFAQDSHDCCVQGTRCSSVVRMLIKLIPAFMCLVDKAGWRCSKFRLVGSCLRRQTRTVPHWQILRQHLHS